MNIYQIKILDASFFLKSLKNIFTRKFVTILERKMKKSWVDQKKDELKTFDFMPILEY